MKLTDIKLLLSELRYYFIENEYEIHNDIKKVLEDNNIEYIHEYKIKKGSRIDFYLPTYKIGIEVKKGNVTSKAIHNQLDRYLQSECISEVLLVSEKFVNIKKDSRIETLYLNNLWF